MEAICTAELTAIAGSEKCHQSLNLGKMRTEKQTRKKITSQECEGWFHRVLLREEAYQFDRYIVGATRKDFPPRAMARKEIFN